FPTGDKDTGDSHPVTVSSRTGTLLQIRHVPELDRVVAAPRDQGPVVDKRQAADEAGVSAKVADELPGPGAPDFHGAVLARRGDPVAVGTTGDGVDVAVVPTQDQEFFAALHVTDLDRVLFVAHHQPLPVRTERHVHAVREEVPGKGVDWLLRPLLLTEPR